MLSDMKFGLSLVTGPTAEPVSLTEAKVHLNEDGTSDDTNITALIATAREDCESFQRRAYVTQTWDLTLDKWPDSDSIELPLPPLQSISFVKYVDKDGNETTWDSSNYFAAVKGEPGRLVLAYGKSWPSTTLRPAEAITVRFVAGYGAATVVPKMVKQAMLLLVGHWYANREAVMAARQGGSALPVPFGVEALLWKDRVF